MAMMINVRWNTAVVCAALLLGVHARGAQSESATGTVPSDPGYGLYYHDPEAAPNLATRWGYHDGWEDGRRDRNHGDVLRPEDKPHYVTPPEHGSHFGVTRQQYNQAYRTAYTRGYEHGSRL
jgi:hypothetical protein